MSRFEELISVLKKDKVPSEKIEDVIKFVSQMVAGKYYLELMGVFTKEEIEEINKTENQEQADVEIKMKFFEKTKKTADQVRNEMYDYYAGIVLDDYLKTKKLPQKPDDQKS